MKRKDSMPENCKDDLKVILSFAEEMIAMADQGESNAEDPSCNILYGILRDFGYKLRKLATLELDIRRQACSQKEILDANSASKGGLR